VEEIWQTAFAYAEQYAAVSGYGLGALEQPFAAATPSAARAKPTTSWIRIVVLPKTWGSLSSYVPVLK
jgi:hypothetical protein